MQENKLIWQNFKGLVFTRPKDKSQEKFLGFIFIITFVCLLSGLQANPT
jgi:hypothetical protein